MAEIVPSTEVLGTLFRASLLGAWLAAEWLGSTLEGVTFGLRNVLDELRTLTQITEPMTLVDSRANSLFWRQMLADIQSMPVVRTHVGQQAAALGAAAFAGVDARV